MLWMIRDISIEHLVLRLQPLLFWSFVKWTLLFSFVFLLLSMSKKIAADLKHLILLLLIYAVVIIPIVNAVFPLGWIGDSPLTRQGQKITNAVNVSISPQIVENVSQSMVDADTTYESLLLPSEVPAFNWYVIFLFIWGAGIVFSSSGLIFGRCRVGILCRSDCEQPNNGEEEEFQEIKKKLSIRRRVGLVICRECTIPFTFRVFNPLIVLPRTSKSWNRECVRAVLVHELFHIKRGDYLTKLIARMVCSFFWFLPFLWIAFSHLSLEQETACDLSVLRRGIRPTEYARHILDIASITMRNLAYQGSFLAEGRKKTLEKRVIHALEFNRAKIKWGGNKMKTTKVVLVCILLVSAIAIVGSCATSKRIITEEDFMTAWSGTWINDELDGTHQSPRILINHPNGTMEFFQRDYHMEQGLKDMRIGNFGYPSITDMWIDRQGKIWYTAVTEPKAQGGTVLSYYGYISESGDVLEILERMSNVVIEEWEPETNLHYQLHRIYYRQ